ncbi:unnamed protein product [Ranitomeya imitator]|uniref:Sulfotransferase n=1 Tax=Ranitomeya imitator TaxID=111125 RepID=A0ABN9LK42_9NEOB|nr:unnamed protein product [Ranitomeya imitator]
MAPYRRLAYSKCGANIKKGTKTELGNYRPVSLASTVGKILEGILRDAILEYLKRNNLMTQYQHGFTRDRSCQTNLISFYEEDLRGSVIKICNFLGKELDDEAVDSVVKHASFKNMKQNNMSNYSLTPLEYMDLEKSTFLRKASKAMKQQKNVKSPILRRPLPFSVGDSRRLEKYNFTVAQNEYFDRIYKAEMKDFSVKFPWDTNIPE